MRISRTFGFVIGIIICLLLAVTALADRVVIPAGTTDIEAEVFYGDRSVTDLDLPEGLLRIETKAFASTSLNSVTLPRSLEFSQRTRLTAARKVSGQAYTEDPKRKNCAKNMEFRRTSSRRLSQLVSLTWIPPNPVTVKRT